MTIHHRLQVRMLRDGVIALGPGKAALLDAIRSDGSISAAARRLSMSYRRAWLLVEEMNRCFSHALVETATGGNRGGGAHLTEAGVEVLSRYRAMEAAAQEAIASHLAGLRSLLADEEPSELNLADSG